ncbi:hypothetical protein Tco_0033113 [Tanacetum coccineum]
MTSFDMACEEYFKKFLVLLIQYREWKYHLRIMIHIVAYFFSTLNSIWDSDFLLLEKHDSFIGYPADDPDWERIPPPMSRNKSPKSNYLPEVRTELKVCVKTYYKPFSSVDENLLEVETHRTCLPISEHVPKMFVSNLSFMVVKTDWKSLWTTSRSLGILSKNLPLPLTTCFKGVKTPTYLKPGRRAFYGKRGHCSSAIRFLRKG